MFWNDPTLYGASFPYRDINPAQTPFLGSCTPWQKHVPSVYGMQPPVLTDPFFAAKEIQTPFVNPTFTPPFYTPPFYGAQQPFNYYNYPQIPQFPQVPQMTLPQIPQIPQFPQVPQMTLPQMTLPHFQHNLPFYNMNLPLWNRPFNY